MKGLHGSGPTPRPIVRPPALHCDRSGFLSLCEPRHARFFWGSSALLRADVRLVHAAADFLARSPPHALRVRPRVHLHAAACCTSSRVACVLHARPAHGMLLPTDLTPQRRVPIARMRTAATCARRRVADSASHRCLRLRSHAARDIARVVFGSGVSFFGLSPGCRTFERPVQPAQCAAAARSLQPYVPRCNA